MPRLTAKDFHPALLALYDHYAHGQITRRMFLDRAAKYTVGGMTAATVLSLMTPDYALANQVSADDPDIVAQYITYPSPNGNGTVRAYLVRPKSQSAMGTGAGAIPGVVVVHENRGLNPYIQDVARRVAKAGYLALAPDGLSSLGGWPGNDERGVAMQSQVDPTKLMNDFFAGVEFMLQPSMTNGKVGIVGFCYGGGVANAVAVAYPELKAAVPFYGMQPKAEDVPRIKAPLLLHYAGLDQRIDAGWPAYEAALKANDKVYEAYIYPGVNHGFHNDTTPRYDEKAATLAWDRTIAWFHKYLA
ncbi:dienelactone hydrolase [Robbsia andropogonis]|uniref:Dienelactone hydrolase n=1 Tax=Robbsia andropogonis TaxID=28092 RepID=A0A0F5K4V1_9BURK|nr:YghX family hydrolase [Robbsia andropogonis]KKB64904.1 dienelactone hydrolase [Robbsia andropogonis]MCP1119165.1 dienelactone hydrolase family protein [Robbsia andropogonis]MCP1128984.1 dienelactone hydrolase family protein [Robbsia andropogonis]